MFSPTGGASLKDTLIALALGNKNNTAGDILKSRQDNRSRRELGGILADALSGVAGGTPTPTGGGQAPIQVAQSGQPSQPPRQQRQLTPLQQAQASAFRSGNIQRGDAIGERITAAQTQRTAQLEKLAANSIQIADSLLQATPQDREIILDYYKQNPPEGFPEGYLERFRGAPDAVLKTERQRALSIKERIAQSNNQRDFGLKEEDTRADNERGDRTLDNTIRKTDAEIDNIGVDNQHQADVLAQTSTRDANATADRQAALAASKSGGVGGKKFNGEQAKSAGFSYRASNANAEMKAITDKGYDPTNVNKKLFSSQAQRQYKRAKRDFTNAILRQESGAVIGPSEFEGADKQYFPQFGDSAETIEVKRQARVQAAEILKAQSQGAFDALFGDGAADKQTKYKEGDTATNAETGGRMIFKNGNWEPM
ncbi:MAG: hypothetical protein COB36_11625 [Alphaproteobacteria bacterium]|nr:MAG: hypothetical protein COB36_11625 [Alphaproteobacteria bacterium]